MSDFFLEVEVSQLVVFEQLVQISNLDLLFISQDIVKVLVSVLGILGRYLFA